MKSTIKTSCFKAITTWQRVLLSLVKMLLLLWSVVILLDNTIYYYNMVVPNHSQGSEPCLWKAPKPQPRSQTHSKQVRNHRNHNPGFEAIYLIIYFRKYKVIFVFCIVVIFMETSVHIWWIELCCWVLIAIVLFPVIIVCCCCYCLPQHLWRSFNLIISEHIIQLNYTVRIGYTIVVSNYHFHCMR